MREYVNDFFTRIKTFWNIYAPLLYTYIFVIIIIILLFSLCILKFATSSRDKLNLAHMKFWL